LEANAAITLLQESVVRSCIPPTMLAVLGSLHIYFLSSYVT